MGLGADALLVFPICGRSFRQIIFQNPKSIISAPIHLSNRGDAASDLCPTYSSSFHRITLQSLKSITSVLIHLSNCSDAM